MLLTEEELIQDRIAEREARRIGKLRILSKENSGMKQKSYTPTEPDTTPTALHTVFSTDIEGYNSFVSNYRTPDNFTKTELPEKYKMKTLANKKGPLYQGGNKSKKNKKRNKSLRKQRRPSRK